MSAIQWSDPIISKFISEWKNGTAPGQYWFGSWDYEKSMRAIYRMSRYISTCINIEKMRMGSLGRGKPENGYSLFMDSLLGRQSSVLPFDPELKINLPAILKDRSYIDFSRHAVISNPRDNERIRNYSMLMGISDPRHEFYDKSMTRVADEIRLDLFLPWGVFVVSNGNHRAMGMIFSGAGKIPINDVKRIYDFEPIFDLVDIDFVRKFGNPFGESLYKIGTLMKTTAIKFGHNRIDSGWLGNY